MIDATRRDQWHIEAKFSYWDGSQWKLLELTLESRKTVEWIVPGDWLPGGIIETEEGPEVLPANQWFMRMQEPEAKP